MKCKCCNREQDLRFGFCFDCANAESIITEGVDMWDEEVTKEEGMSITLSKLKKILTIYGVVKIQEVTMTNNKQIDFDFQSFFLGIFTGMVISLIILTILL